MKTILLLSILFSAIAMPALGALTDADLDKIRLIVNDSEKRVKQEVKAEIAIIDTKLEGLDARLRNVENDIAELRGRSIALTAIKDWGLALCLGVLIVSIIALRKKQPQHPHNAQDTPKAASQE